MGDRCWSSGSFTEPATHGQGAVLPDRLPSRAGPTPAVRCCVSSFNGPLSIPNPRSLVHADCGTYRRIRTDATSSPFLQNEAGWGVALAAPFVRSVWPNVMISAERALVAVIWQSEQSGLVGFTDNGLQSADDLRLVAVCQSRARMFNSAVTDGRVLNNAPSDAGEKRCGAWHPSGNCRCSVTGMRAKQEKRRRFLQNEPYLLASGRKDEDWAGVPACQGTDRVDMRLRTALSKVWLW